MDNYIDRAALMGKLTSAETQQKLKQASGAEAYNEFLFLVNDAPAADVAPVVRCEDCKYHHDCETHFCDRLGMDCPDASEFFCKYGGRNEVT